MPVMFPISSDIVHAFTNGSKFLEGVGYITIFTQCNGHINIFQERLPVLCNTFEAEAFAIKRALDETVPFVSFGSTACIHSDVRVKEKVLDGLCALVESAQIVLFHGDAMQ